MESRNEEAMRVTLAWASRGRTRLNGQLRVEDETRDRHSPPKEDLPLQTRLREDGQAWYAPARVGMLLGLRPEQLAQRVCVDVTEMDAWPPGPQLQSYLP